MTYAQEKNIGIDHALMFRLVMENEENCKEFLQRTLGITIRKLEFLDPEKSIEIDFASKGIRLDVYVEDENGASYDIEMQVGQEKNELLGKRSRYYQSMMDASALKKGQKYTLLRKSFVIFVCTYDPFDKDLYYYTFSNICHQDKSLELQDSCAKIILNTKGKQGYISQELKNLLDYIDKKVPNDEYTGTLDSLVQMYKSDPKRSDLFMTYENLAATFESIGEERGFAKGIEQGIEQGKNEGRIENFIELLKDKVITLDYVRASGKVTDSDLEQIEAALAEN